MKNSIKSYCTRFASAIFMLTLILGLLTMYACKSSKSRKPAYRPTVKAKPTVMADVEEKEKEDDKEEEVEAVEEEPFEEAISMRESRIEKVMATADSYLGTKHRMGGTSKSGIDCSGLVLVSFKSIDIPLPRSSHQQISVGKKVKIENLQRGDLVFFTYPGGKKVTHVGIVDQVRGKSDVTFIHTSSSKGVRIDNVFSTYWRQNYVGARRIL